MERTLSVLLENELSLVLVGLVLSSPSVLSSLDGQNGKVGHG